MDRNRFQEFLFWGWRRLNILAQKMGMFSYFTVNKSRNHAKKNLQKLGSWINGIMDNKYSNRNSYSWSTCWMFFSNCDVFVLLFFSVITLPCLHSLAALFSVDISLLIWKIFVPSTESCSPWTLCVTLSSSLNRRIRKIFFPSYNTSYNQSVLKGLRRRRFSFALLWNQWWSWCHCFINTLTRVFWLLDDIYQDFF